MFKVNTRNTRKMCEICSKLTIKTQERRQWLRSGVSIVNFVNISHLFLVFLLLFWTSKCYLGFKPAIICSKLTWRRSSVFVVNFEYISHLFIVVLLLTLSRQMSAWLQHLNMPLKIISFFKSCELNSVSGLSEIFRKFLEKLNL